MPSKGAKMSIFNAAATAWECKTSLPPLNKTHASGAVVKHGSGRGAQGLARVQHAVARRSAGEKRTRLRAEAQRERGDGDSEAEEEVESHALVANVPHTGTGARIP
eukprot:2613612-Pleurochrysis_carterae.AAC.1